MERREKIEQAVKERERVRLDAIQKKWTKREEGDFLRVLTGYGVDLQVGAAVPTPDWTRFKAMARLDKKSDESLSDYYKVFIAMCKRQAGVRLTEEEKGLEGIIDDISEDHARLVLDRLELLSKLREVNKNPISEERLTLCQNNLDSPDWWEPGKHDKELIRAVLKHGLYRTEQTIFTDPEFSFGKCERAYADHLELQWLQCQEAAAAAAVMAAEMEKATKYAEQMQQQEQPVKKEQDDDIILVENNVKVEKLVVEEKPTEPKDASDVNEEKDTIAESKSTTNEEETTETTVSQSEKNVGFEEKLVEEKSAETVEDKQKEDETEEKSEEVSETEKEKTAEAIEIASENDAQTDIEQIENESVESTAKENDEFSSNKDTEKVVDDTNPDEEPQSNAEKQTEAEPMESEESKVDSKPNSPERMEVDDNDNNSANEINDEQNEEQADVEETKVESSDEKEAEQAAAEDQEVLKDDEMAVDEEKPLETSNGTESADNKTEEQGEAEKINNKSLEAAEEVKEKELEIEEKPDKEETEKIESTADKEAEEEPQSTTDVKAAIDDDKQEVSEKVDDTEVKTPESVVPQETDTNDVKEEDNVETIKIEPEINLKSEIESIPILEINDDDDDDVMIISGKGDPDDDEVMKEKEKATEEECKKQAAELKARFPDLEVIQPLLKMKTSDWHVKSGEILRDLQNKSKMKFNRTIKVRWFRDFALEKRISHIIYCIENFEWPVPKSYTAYAGCQGINLDIPLNETIKHTYTSSAIEMAATRRSQTPDVITITTDQSLAKQLQASPVLSSNLPTPATAMNQLPPLPIQMPTPTAGKKRKRHIAIDVETERAKLQALLNSSQTQPGTPTSTPTTPISATKPPAWPVSSDEEPIEAKRTNLTGTSLQPPPAHQHPRASSTPSAQNQQQATNYSTKPKVIPGTSSTLTPIDLSSR